MSLCRNTISLKAAKSWSQFLYRQNCDLNRNVCSSGYLINNKQCAKTRYFYDLQFKREALRPIIMGILIYWRGDLLWFTLESIWIDGKWEGICYIWNICLARAWFGVAGQNPGENVVSTVLPSQLVLMVSVLIQSM